MNVLLFGKRGVKQGGRTWQAFGGGKNGHETFRQARIYTFRDKCVVFAHNLKFSGLMMSEITVTFPLLIIGDREVAGGGSKYFPARKEIE